MIDRYQILYDDASDTIVIEPKKPFYSIKEVSTILGVSHQSVRRAIQSERLKAQRDNWKFIIPYAALQDLILRRWAQ